MWKLWCCPGPAGALAGCDGVVASGLELPALRQAIDGRLLVVTPGIRPVDNRPVDDQKRVVTVEQAFGDGADYIVVGRPIRDALNPRAAAEKIQTSIGRLFSPEALLGGFSRLLKLVFWLSPRLLPGLSWPV